MIARLLVLLYLVFSSLLKHGVDSAPGRADFQQGEVNAAAKWSNSWAVELEGGTERANEIAKSHGLVNLGQIGSLQDKYTFVKIEDDDNDIESPYQFFATPPAHLIDIHTALTTNNEIKYALHQQPRRLFKRELSSSHHDIQQLDPLTSDNGQLPWLNDKQSTSLPLSTQAAMNPIWNDQWCLNNTGQTGETELLLDINVVRAWNLEYSGKGVLIAVVDDGVEGNHGDLERNFDFSNSYNFVSNNMDPSPNGTEEDHGTACAGIIGMILRNSICGVGVAYNSQIAGLRIPLGAEMVDSQEAGALSHNRNSIDIYSNSWGPNDNGFTVAGPGPLAQVALAQGSTEGRNGLGNIFTFAAGNGGAVLDSCAADGFSQSIYTIPVGAYNEMGGPAYYDEKCSAKMTVAYVDNTRDQSLQVATLGLGNTCKLTFDGTSAATPMVSGVISLALEANPQLTWRDVQYLIVYTSNPQPLLTNTDDYFTNGAGLTVSHQFGFGAIDAEAMVTRAQNWSTVPSQINDTVTPSTSSGEANYSSPFRTSLVYSGDIQYLEHIVVTMTLNVTGYEDIITPETAGGYVEAALENNGNDATEAANDFSTIAIRGNLRVSITSPNDTRSTLLFPRGLDIVNSEGYDQWPFLSVLHWGEDPHGQWTITVDWTNPNEGAATVEGVSVQFYGVSSDPFTPSSALSMKGSMVIIVFLIIVSTYILIK